MIHWVVARGSGVSLLLANRFHIHLLKACVLLLCSSELPKGWQPTTAVVANLLPHASQTCSSTALEPWRRQHTTSTLGIALLLIQSFKIIFKKQATKHSLWSIWIRSIWMDIRLSGQIYTVPWHSSTVRQSQHSVLSGEWGCRKSGHQLNLFLESWILFLCLHEMLPGLFSYNF